MRKFDKLSLARYCGFGDDAPRGFNWHGATQEYGSRCYRCTCFPQFRMPDGSFGPHGSPRGRRKAYTLRKGMKQYSIGKHLPGY